MINDPTPWPHQEHFREFLDYIHSHKQEWDFLTDNGNLFRWYLPEYGSNDSYPPGYQMNQQPLIQPSNQETTPNQITNNCCEEIKKVVSDKGIGEANLKINNPNPDHLVPHIFDENHNFIALGTHQNQILGITFGPET